MNIEELIERRCHRLDELAIAVTQGREAVEREFTMRVPADENRDADIVLAWATQTIREQRAEIERFRKMYADEGRKAMVLLEENSRLRAEIEGLTLAFNERVRVIEMQLNDKKELQAEIERLQKGLAAVENLIGDSLGVYGLHQNGDPAPWSELRTGGLLEGWLTAFDEAVDELTETGCRASGDSGSP